MEGEKHKKKQQKGKAKKQEMDPAERMVLRKRKPTMITSFQLTHDLLEDLVDVGLLSQGAVQYIELEKSMSSRIVKLIDTLISLNSPDAFATFVFTLARHDEKLSRDLQADLRIERGEVHPSQETLMDASMAVHMRFGTSKRFSEGDKRYITELIATKLTIAHEEWDQDMSTIRLQLSQERSKNRSLADKSRLCVKSVREFIKRYEQQLTTYAHDLHTTRSVMESTLDESDVGTLGRFYEDLKKLLVRMSVIIEQQEGLAKEHAKMAEVMKTSGQYSLLNAGDGAHGSLDHAEKDRLIKRLNKKVSDLEAECEMYQNLLEQMKPNYKGRKSFIQV